MTPRRVPVEAIPSLEFVCFGGPRDGELAGYLADDEPTPTDEGCYVVSRELRLEWAARG